MWSNLKVLVLVLYQVSVATALPSLFSNLLHKNDPIDCFSVGGVLAFQGRKCVLYLQNEDVSGIKLSIYAFTSLSDDSQPAASSDYLPQLRRSARRVLPDYASLIQSNNEPVLFEVVVYLSEDFAERGETHWNAPNVCSVQIGGTGNSQTIKQILAHELYHCVQYASGITQPEDASANSSEWWYEGSPEYFATYYYPHATFSDHITTYQPELQLFNQFSNDTGVSTYGYGASLFFMHLNNLGIANLVIHKWVIAQKATDDLLAEQHRVAPDLFISEAFPSFATQFIDRLINYPGGNAVHSQHRKDYNVNYFDFPVEPGTWEQQVIVLPFGIWQEVRTTLPTGPTITISLASKTEFTDDKVTVLQYRQKGDKLWTTLALGQSAVINTATCGGSNEYSFLVVSTYNAPTIDLWEANIIFDIKDTPTNKIRKRQQDNGEAASCQQIVSPTISASTNPSTTPSTTGGDQCLVGTWNLDIPGMQTLMAQQLSTSTTSITNVVVTGSANLVIDASFTGTETLNHVDISYDGSADGFAFHTLIDLTGSVGGVVTVGTPGTFTWASLVVAGTAATTTTVDGLGDPIEIDIPLGDQYSPSLLVQYTCSGNSLTMAGYNGGNFTWANSWTRA